MLIRNTVKETAFLTAYEALNDAQKEAVECIDGPVMVIAGPGTGKTQVLTLRIANILLKTDTKADQILALTFTENGARAMRERLRTFIGEEAYRLNIYTFHGFCEQLIRKYPDAYSTIIGGKVARDLERFRIIEAILQNGDIKILRPFGDPTYYVKSILSEISILKKEFILPVDLVKILKKQEIDLNSTEKLHVKGPHKGKVRKEYTDKEKQLQKNRELLFVYQAYEAYLKKEKLYDFDDMIEKTIEALKSDESMLRDLQESYLYILADEHQDVNGSQNELLRLLASYHDSPNLFVVGDEKQAIFRFQGASLENFLYFENQYPKTKTIALLNNYRSTQNILDFAHSLIEVKDGPLLGLRLPLKSTRSGKGVIETKEYSHQAIEDEMLMRKIEVLLKDGVKASEIAVIVRTNNEVESISRMLRGRGVATEASAESDILTHPITLSVLALLEAVMTPSEEALFRILHSGYLGIESSDLFKLLSSRSYERPLRKLISDENILKELNLKNPESIIKLSSLEREVSKRALTEAPHRLLGYILTESHLIKNLMEVNPHECRLVVRRLYDEVEAMVIRGEVKDLIDVVSQFKQLTLHNLTLTAPYVKTNDNAVLVMTAHKAKGLEFSHVFLPHLNDNLWGGRKNRQVFKIPITKHLNEAEFDSEDDDKRLLYVAMTRAKKHLGLSYSKNGVEGRELSPSRFLSLIDEAKSGKMKDEEIEMEFDPLIVLETRNNESIIDAVLVLATLKERGLSSTALNNYLESPWNYIYRNLLRLPEVQSLSLQFGTVVHSVLEKVVNKVKGGGKGSVSSLIKQELEWSLGKIPLSTEEYTRLHEKGFSAISIYLDNLLQKIPSHIKTEASFKVHLPLGIKEFPEIILTGKIDRLDFDKNGKVIKIVDYKTGKPKSRNVIEGKTKDGNANYKRQLVFYALLLELYGEPNYRCKEGVLSFVEPDSKGEVHEESFTISDTEIKELKTEIKRVVIELISGEYAKIPCDKKVCDYCDLVDTLKI